MRAVLCKEWNGPEKLWLKMFLLRRFVSAPSA